MVGKKQQQQQTHLFLPYQEAMKLRSWLSFSPTEKNFSKLDLFNKLQDEMKPRSIVEFWNIQPSIIVWNLKLNLNSFVDYWPTNLMQKSTVYEDWHIWTKRRHQSLCLSFTDHAILSARMDTKPDVITKNTSWILRHNKKNTMKHVTCFFSLALSLSFSLSLSLS